MATAIRVLIIEDSEIDAELLLRELRQGGYDPVFEQVDTPEAMNQALAGQQWDIIIADYVMPRFSGLAALQQVREKGLDVPFILLSGKVGEDTAVDAMKAGAHDYIVKGNLARLIPAIQRELREAVVRREGRVADEALRRAHEELRLAHAELEVRVEERTAELAAANVGLQAEISERKRVERERELLLQQLETERALLEAVLRQMPSGVIVVEAASEKVILGNERVESIWYRPAQSSGSLADLTRCPCFHPADGTPYEPKEWPLARSIASGEVVIGEEIEFRRGDGSTCTVSTSSAPIRDGEGRIVAGVAVFTDVTERIEADRTREEYVRLIGHDLRNPLAGLIGHAQLLQRFLLQKGLERESASAETIFNNANRLNAMIQDLVESSRLESGQLELNRDVTDILPLVSEIAARTGAVQDQARIKVLGSEWVPPVLVDLERIERVLVNLITNALKYSSPDSPVVIRVRRVEGEAVVSVSDQGFGIPAEDLPHLFQRFYRAKTGKKAEGLGLGLYICRLIVEEHRGRIWVESEPGKGSTFYFSLPLAQI
ncbi:MAG: ATP-binding protein [Chloroflexi bacterium]|nr:ATP-binding protein [Chloroflexota bacterium]